MFFFFSVFSSCWKHFSSSGWRRSKAPQFLPVIIKLSDELFVTETQKGALTIKYLGRRKAFAAISYFIQFHLIIHFWIDNKTIYFKQYNQTRQRKFGPLCLVDQLSVVTISLALNLVSQVSHWKSWVEFLGEGPVSIWMATPADCTEYRARICWLLHWWWWWLLVGGAGPGPGPGPTVLPPPTKLMICSINKTWNSQ